MENMENTHKLQIKTGQCITSTMHKKHESYNFLMTDLGESAVLVSVDNLDLQVKIARCHFDLKDNLSSLQASLHGNVIHFDVKNRDNYRIVLISSKNKMSKGFATAFGDILVKDKIKFETESDFSSLLVQVDYTDLKISCKFKEWDPLSDFDTIDSNNHLPTYVSRYSVIDKH